MKRKHTLLLLLLGIGLHYLVLALFTFNALPQQTRNANAPFLFHHGGDNYGYHAQAISLMTGNFQPNQYPLGFPILMIPPMWLLPDKSHDAVIQPIAILWAFIGFPLGQWLLICLVRQMIQNETVALIASALWAILPLVYYFGLSPLWNPQMGEIIAIHSTWAQMLSDGPAALFTLLAAVLFFGSRERNYDWLSLSALGAVLGFLGMIRFSGLLIAVVIGLLLLIEKRWKPAFWLTAVALFCFSPQMFYNRHFFGSPFETGYSQLSFVPETGLLNPIYLSVALGQIWGYLGLFTLPLLALLAGVFLFILWRLFLINRIAALFMGGWVSSYIAFYSLYYYSWTGAFMRFMIPLEPALMFLAGFLLWELYQFFWKSRQSSPAQA